MPDKPTVEQLEFLSAKATQGEFKPENPHEVVGTRTTVCYMHFGKPLGPRPEIDGYSDCVSLASERGLADATFIAALVNFWRSGGAELVRKAQAMDRALTWLHNANEDVRDGKINYRPDDHIAVIDAARKDMSAELKGEGEKL